MLGVLSVFMMVMIMMYEANGLSDTACLGVQVVVLMGSSATGFCVA